MSARVRDKVHSRGDLLFIAAFLALLIAGAFGVASHFTPFLHYENRYAFPVSDVDFSGIAKGIPPDFERALKDRCYRDALVKIETGIQKYVLRRPYVNHIHAARPHVYDFTDHPSYRAHTAAQMAEVYAAIDETVGRLQKSAEALRAAGSELIVLPMPLISSAMADPKDVFPPEAVDRPAEAYLAHALDRAGIRHIRPREVLGLDAFYATDHHISHVGYFAVLPKLEAMLSDLGVGLLDTPIRLNMHAFRGSRSRMMGEWTGTDPIAEPVYARPLLRSGDGCSGMDDFQTRINYPSYMQGDHPHTHVEAKDGRGDALVIYGDSFTNIFESFLAPRLGQLDAYDFRFARSDAPRTDVKAVVLIASESAFREGKDYLVYLP